MKNLLSQKLGKYYLDRTRAFKLPKRSTRTIDKNGVLLNKIPYTQRWNYYPCDISLYALGNFEKFLDTDNPKYKKVFLKQADWLVSNIRIKNGFGVWEHHYKLPFYNFKIPWVHGMAQGLSISVLLRAFQITDNDSYFETATQAYNSYKVNISEGGIKFIDSNKNVWFEEYAILPPPHILNGFIFSLFGIYDYFRVTQNQAVLDLWTEGIDTLINNIPRYDTAYWSLYNLSQKYPATYNYHNLHIKQLNVLSIITKERVIRDY